MEQQGLFGSLEIFSKEPLSAQGIRAWVTFQVLALFLQGHLWQEVRGNMNLYEETLQANCAPERSKDGICVGPLWNVSAREEFALQGKSWQFKPKPHRFESTYRPLDSVEAIDAEISRVQEETNLRIKELKDKRFELQVTQGLILGNGSGRSHNFNSSFVFQFDTHSAPAIFLLSIEPLTERTDSMDGRWYVEVKRLEPPAIGNDLGHFQRGSSSRSRVLMMEDMSQEAFDSVHSRGYVRWEAVIRNSAVLRSGRNQSAQRFVAFVEDFQSPQLGKIYASSQCSLIGSWKAFNKQQQGHHHRALAWCRDLLGWLLPLGALATWAAHSASAASGLRPHLAQSSKMEESEQMELCFEDGESGQEKLGSDGRSGYFQGVIVMKLLVIDIPQQICMVLYLLGWYETTGLRCQLCLFHPQHCEAEHPFKLANSAAYLSTLLSSMSHQFLLASSSSKAHAEDPCSWWMIRIGILCVSTLPFSTGVCVATSALLSLPVIMKILVFLPCVLGWISLLTFVLFCWAACGASL